MEGDGVFFAILDLEGETRLGGLGGGVGWVCGVVGCRWEEEAHKDEFHVWEVGCGHGEEGGIGVVGGEGGGREGDPGVAMGCEVLAGGFCDGVGSVLRVGGSDGVVVEECAVATGENEVEGVGVWVADEEDGFGDCWEGDGVDWRAEKTSVWG